jgi:L,D-transpeptidase YcbB
MALGQAPTKADAAPEPREVAETIRRSVEQLRSTGRVTVAGQSLRSLDALPEIYETRGFRPLWRDPANEEALLGEIAAVGGDGLDPGDYHFAALRSALDQRARRPDDPLAAAAADLLLTDALLRLAAHLHFGKLDPATGRARWDLEGEIRGEPAVAVVARMATSRGLAAQINDLRPLQPFYGRLKSALARYRVVGQGGGWEPIPSGRVLQAGMDDRRVVALRRRLAATGDLREPELESSRFDERLESALRRFQARHQLGTDGMLGPATLRALNLPVERRQDQLRANLERARWLLPEVRGRFLVLDPAAGRVVLMDNSQPVLEQPADFAPEALAAPEFRGELRYFVVNPDWVLPRSLVETQVAALARRAPEELAARGLEVFDRAGRPADARQLDWGRPSDWVVRQSPHPRSFLGQVRFAIPNARQVFLHGGPEQGGGVLAGSVRAADALALAAALAGPPALWTRETLRVTVESGAPASFAPGLPVAVIYAPWTAWVDTDGVVGFRPGYVERDGAIIAGLSEPAPTP